MAFIQQGTTVYSFADYDDVVAMDQRLFQANEGLTRDSVEGNLVRSTQRILDMLRNTDWWKSYYIIQAGSSAQVITGQSIQVPALQANLILARQADFTDLAVYHSLSEYIYPAVADFGNPDSAERQKIGFYNEKFRALFDELVVDGDWYDFDGDDTIQASEKYPFVTNLVRRR